MELTVVFTGGGDVASVSANYAWTRYLYLAGGGESGGFHVRVEWEGNTPSTCMPRLLQRCRW